MVADKVLRDNAFNIAKDLNYDEYQHRIASMVYKSFDKETSGNGIKNETFCNKELVKKLHKTINRKFNKRKVHLPLMDNVWGADLADM